MAKLILRSEEGDKEFSLDEKGSLTIGRSPDCDITISDTQASRRHCSVVKVSSGYEVADLGSTNGTLVNSTLIKRQKLRHGDVIRIGAVEIVYDDPSAKAAGTGETGAGFLVWAKGDQKGEKIELSAQRTTIGRKPTNTIVLQDTVSSSYHCEIVRDLNGYTIRDLGSTNGTLVNGEMITEAQLTHGARIRIGNTRFVFQDPAMAEIDIELASVEDEDEWGMMRDLDLAAVRKRNPATIVYGLLLVALLGAGAYFLVFAQPQGSGERGPQPPEGNRHEAFSFESPATRFSWQSEPAGDVAIRVGSAVVGQGRSSLELSPRRDDAVAFYTTTLDGESSRFRLRAKAAARGGASVRIGLLWIGLGLERWALSDPVASGSLTDVDLELSSPPWASRVRLGVRLSGERGTVYLDDVSLVRVGPPDQIEVTQNEFRVIVVDGRDVDISHAGAQILANGRLVARDEAGAERPAPDLTLSVEKADDEHLLLAIRGGEEAALVGLELEEIYGYLSRGGFRAFTPDQEQTFASFPTEGTEVLTGVRKLLLGPSGRAFAVLPEEEGGRLRAEASADGPRGTFAVLGPPSAEGFRFRFKTNLRGEAAAASQRMTQALALYRNGAWGEFRTQAQEALAEFPFASRTMRKQLQDLLKEVNADYVAHLDQLEKEVAEYKAFKDLQDLADARRIIAYLESKHGVEPGKGPRGEELGALADEVASLLQEARRTRQSKLAEPLFVQATIIHLPKEEPYSAALLLSYVAWFLEKSEEAAAASAELSQIAESEPRAVEVLRKLDLKKEE